MSEKLFQVGDIVRFKTVKEEPRNRDVIIQIEEKLEYTVSRVVNRYKDRDFVYIEDSDGSLYGWFDFRFKVVNSHQLKSVETDPQYEGLFE